ncbi:hypothetical protein GQ43DRAFT_269924 [Delitschia confertaspora ATCC 74209]|uniref:Uncharacterized protein n=1 Tax=Delitschia confertaspora ATCC 74209 TaxID=1513339 RepID=A0A9P4JWJ7_9PLEO|nr:hypothetical protein GQ43DRAFT_269924 [Delitschia confertaspora ATCC 74209]
MPHPDMKRFSCIPSSHYILPFGFGLATAVRLIFLVFLSRNLTIIKTLLLLR